LQSMENTFRRDDAFDEPNETNKKEHDVCG
jgi:hypothetical protein